MTVIDASSLPRIMAGCEGSIALTQQINRPSAPSDAAREGMAAHLVWRNMLRRAINDPQKLVGEIIIIDDGSSFIVTQDIVDNVTPYVEKILARNFQSGDAERKCDFDVLSGYRIAARCDWYDYSHNVLHIDDLKYGWRLVDPFENWTLIAYAIGVIKSFGTQDIEYVEFTIHQPRPYHPDGPSRTWRVTATELFELLQRIISVFQNLDDTLVTGSHCYKCAAAAVCNALREASMSAIDIITQGYDDTLSPAELGYELDLMNRAEQVIKIRANALRELAEHLLRSGKPVTGYSLNPVVGNRAWNEGITPEIIKALTGVDVTEAKIISPAAAGRKGIPSSVIDTLTHRPSNGFRVTAENVDTQARRLFGQP